MNLETTIEPRLWDAIRLSIEARKFSSAVLDATHFLSELIRERSGLEGDGAALIGAAFGGKSPKLKVNRLQTESEQNIQRGIESLLRGLYQAIRNPRSHGISEDSERDSQAILLFIDYLLRIVEGSRSPFSLSNFVDRVLDRDFVPDSRYAKLLVDEIPPTKRLAVCCEVFARRSEAQIDRARYFFSAIFPVMKIEEIDELCSLFTDELRQTDDEGTVRFVLGISNPDIWMKISEVARLRIEHKLIQSIKDGKWSSSRGRTSAGALGTWATGFIQYFTLKEQLWRTVWAKLESSSIEEQDYAFKYLLPQVETCFSAPPKRLAERVIEGIEAGDERFKLLAERWENDFVDERSEADPWRAPFIQALKSFVVAEQVYGAPPSDDIPF